MMSFRSVAWKCLALCAGLTLMSAAPSQESGDRFAGIRARPVGPVRSIGGIGYIAPEGWQVTQQGRAAVLIGPVKKEWQPCVIVIDPTVPPGSDLASQAEMVVNANFGRNFGRYHGGTGTDLKSGQLQGVSATGWPYVDLFGQLGTTNFYVRTILAQYDGHAVALMGLTQAVDCLGSNFLRSNDKFQLLFHSLQLPGFTQESGDLAKQLVGSWQSVSSSASVAVIYAANGHFDDVGAVGSYHTTNLGQLIYETHSTWPGNGSYQVAGDRLTMTRNGGSAETTLFSIVRRPKPNGRYDQVLRIVEPAKYGPTWGFGDTGHYVIDYTKTEEP
jgi:hypothetical protein